MAEYIYMQNYARHGKMGISYRVIEHVALAASRGLEELVQIPQGTKERPIRCSITKGRAYLAVECKVKTGFNASEAASTLQKAIAERLLDTVELSDCTININVKGIF